MALDAPAGERIAAVTAAAAAAAGATMWLLGAVLRPRSRPRSAAGREVMHARVDERARKRGRRRERAIARAFPDALDLFVVTVQAGYSPLEALRSLCPLVHPSIGEVFEVVIARVDRGGRFVDALSVITDALGPRGSAFVDTLTMTEQAGLPLGPAIERLADEARQHRRRLADADARQLPIRLSFPLVLCTLTSFVLVAIVPLLLGALTSFDRSSP